MRSLFVLVLDLALNKEDSEPLHWPSLIANAVQCFRAGQGACNCCRLPELFKTNICLLDGQTHPSNRTVD